MKFTRSTGMLSGKKGFSLLETLLVVAIILILVGVSTRGLLPTLSAQKLSNTSSRVLDELLLARQKAITTGSPVLIRFFKQNGNFIGFQTYVFRDGARVPASGVSRLDEAVVIHPSPVFSSLPVNALVGNQSDPAVPPSLQGGVRKSGSLNFVPTGA